MAKSTPTATKLSQNPGCNRAHGSMSKTVAAAVARIACQGHVIPHVRNRATVSSMVQVRCAGTPQPLNQA